MKSSFQFGSVSYQWGIQDQVRTDVHLDRRAARWANERIEDPKFLGGLGYDGYHLSIPSTMCSAGGRGYRTTLNSKAHRALSARRSWMSFSKLVLGPLAWFFWGFKAYFAWICIKRPCLFDIFRISKGSALRYGGKEATILSVAGGQAGDSEELCNFEACAFAAFWAWVEC